MKPRIAIPVPHSDKDYTDRALSQYVQAVEQAGGEPVVVDLNLSNAEVARLASTCRAILLPGSKADVDPQKYGASQRHPLTAPSDPPRDNVDELLLQDAFNMHKPILGVCYGMQSLNVWRAGTLLQHVESPVTHRAERTVAEAHSIHVEPGSHLAGLMNLSPGTQDPWVNSSHHQALGNVGDGLRAVAWAEDGIIEAVEAVSPEQFVLGVQWHPERTYEQNPASQSIFRNFIEAARNNQPSPGTAADFESLYDSTK
ncbi:MAG TPA: gamma-glutamyl-gamma-aminobutyrate hydrolase family protein [Terriglobales bacterium]|nr:gamma-glutamyl-gamma-aminobutyrate hydrolase family protein [Terriglobales bacterium]